MCILPHPQELAGVADVLEQHEHKEDHVADQDAVDEAPDRRVRADHARRRALEHRIACAARSLCHVCVEEHLSARRRPSTSAQR